MRGADQLRIQGIDGRVLENRGDGKIPKQAYGAMDAESQTQIAGQVTCVLQDSSRRLDFAGSWKASR